MTAAEDPVRELLAEADAARDETIGLLQELVRMPTVNVGARPDTGDETGACELLRARLDAAGVPSEIFESAPGRGNLLVRLGTGDKRLVLMAHTDVVPVEDETLWEHPPFSGAIDRGRIYGRGADDDKADVVAYTMALALLRRAGLEPAGELVFLAAADEESGGRWGAGWMVDRYADRLRADWAVNEGGGNAMRSPIGLLYTVGTGEKGRLEARITHTGRSGHASRPWASKNPVLAIGDSISRIAAYDSEIDVSHPFFREVLAALGVEHTPRADNIDRICDELGESGHSALAITLRAASRLTITPTMLNAGVKTNSIPDRARLVCDVRALPGQDDAFVREELIHLLRGLDVDVDVQYTAVSNASPADAPFVRQLGEALAAGLGSADFHLLPALTVGFTDSRFVRPLGTQVYGFSPQHPIADPNQPSGVHGNNEFIEIETLLLRVRFALALIGRTLGVKRV